MRKITVIVSEISNDDFVELAERIATACEEARSDVFMIVDASGSPDPQKRINLDPLAN